MGNDVKLHKQPGCWLRSSHTFKECVTAHWSSEFARKITGAKLSTEIADLEVRSKKLEERIRGEDMSGIKSYEDLEVYKEGYALTLEMYKLTKDFPKEEKYDLISQVRRASSSIPLNISEGYGRRTELEFKRFLNISAGSCNEMQVLVSLSKDLGYISEEEYRNAKERYDVLGRRIYILGQNWNVRKSNI